MTRAEDDHNSGYTSPATSEVSKSDPVARAARATSPRPLPSTAPTSQLPGGNEAATGCSVETRLGGAGDNATKTTTSDASPVNTNSHPKSTGFGPIWRWRLMKIGRFSATVVVSKSSARKMRRPVEPDTPRLVGRMKMKKYSINGIRQLSERMTRTTSQSTTRRGGSAEPIRNRASAADRNAGSGCRHEPIVKTP